MFGIRIGSRSGDGSTEQRIEICSPSFSKRGDVLSSVEVGLGGEFEGARDQRIKSSPFKGMG